MTVNPTHFRVGERWPPYKVREGDNGVYEGKKEQLDRICVRLNWERLKQSSVEQFIGGNNRNC